MPQTSPEFQRPQIETLPNLAATFIQQRVENVLDRPPGDRRDVALANCQLSGPLPGVVPSSLLPSGDFERPQGLYGSFPSPAGMDA